ncbi:glycosyltransferase [Caldisphaera sp.]|uniref:glycosyltransferase n=1 Tax=Caldisphaera sp. TaxID=2060322 RepID=UPI0025BED475|nr:glycosyltransferase [Caldisphaera sp.]
MRYLRLYQLEDLVELIGDILRYVIKLYLDSCIFILQTRAKSFGIVIAEALAMELKVIIAEDACTDLFEKLGATVVPKDDIDALAIRWPKL